MLAKFLHLESIPKDSSEWHVNVANAGSLSSTLKRDWDNASHFRRLATLRTDVRLFADVDQLNGRVLLTGSVSWAFGLTQRELNEPRQIRRRQPKQQDRPIFRPDSAMTVATRQKAMNR